MKPVLIRVWLVSLGLLLVGVTAFAAPQRLFSEPFRPYDVSPAPWTCTTADVNRDGWPDILVAQSSLNAVALMLGTGGGAFAPATLLPTGVYPKFVTTGDINGDGKLDVVAAAAGASVISILLGHDDGTFDAHYDITTGDANEELAVADMDGDGDQDIVATNPGAIPTSMTVMWNYFQGTYWIANTYPAGTESATAVAVADLNGDGLRDIAVTSFGLVSIFLYRGYQLFQSETTYAAVNNRITSVEIDDVTGDGVPDLVTGNGSQKTSCSVFPGNGDGTFGLRIDFLDTYSSETVALADLDGDGLLDMVGTTAAYDASLATVRLGQAGAIFGPPSHFRTAFEPLFVHLSDIDGDGRIDAVVPTGSDFSVYNTSTLSLLWGNGDGTFGAPALSTDGSSPTSLTAGEFTGDGIADLAVTNYYDAIVSILAGDGMGGFVPAAQLATGNYPHGIVSGDFNDDGTADLVVSNGGSGKVSIFLGSSGGFGSRSDVTIGSNPYALALGDANGDGHVDVAVTVVGFSAVGLLLGNGDGTFMQPQLYRVGKDPFGIVFTDLTGDGYEDLATSNYTDGTVSLLAGRGDGTYSRAASFPAGQSPWGLASADGNQDGIADLVVANYDANTVSVLQGTGGGLFAPPVAYQVGRNPTGVVFSDLDADGRPDITSANYASYTVSYLKGLSDGTYATAEPFGAGPGPYSLLAFDVTNDTALELLMPNELGNTVTCLVHSILVTAVPTQRGPSGHMAVAASVEPGGDVRLEVSTPDAGVLSLDMFDVAGRLAGSVARSPVRPGTHLRQWSRKQARRALHGVYFWQATVGHLTATARIVFH